MKHRFYYCDNEATRNYIGSKTYFTHQKPIDFSVKFCRFFSDKFEELFILATGIRPSTKVNITLPNRDDSPQLYEPGFVSRLNMVLWIMPDYYDDVSFCWQSKTGIMVIPTDEDFNLDDLECWLQGIKAGEYWKQVGTEKKVHPFQHANFPFELKVFNFGVNMELRIYLEENSIQHEIKEVVSGTIRLYNDTSEASNRINGVVHNFKFMEEANFICLVIDTGSAGVAIIKKILNAFVKMAGIIKIEVDL